MSVNKGHIAIRLADFNLIDKNDYVAKELLLDYNNNDLIIPQDDNEIFSFQTYIKKLNNLKMSELDHASKNCHPFVSDKKSGYLSNIDYVSFIKNIRDTEKIINLIMKLIDKHMYSVDELTYALNGNTLSITECKISNLLIAADISEDVNFTLPNTNIKYQTTDWIKLIMVKLDILNNQITIISLDKNEENIVNYDDVIYNWDDTTKTYKTKDNKFTLIPLLEVDVITKETNVIAYTGITDTDDILEKELAIVNKNENLFETVSLTSNIYKLNNNDNILISVPFNKEESEIIQCVDLSKKCNYKSSPFGFMMLNSRNIGNPINVTSFKDFILDFYTDKDYLNIKLEEVITINYSSNALITISLSKDTFKINDEEFQFDFNKNNKYMEFSVIKKGIDIIIRFGSSAKTIKLNEITSTTKFDNLNIVSLNTPLGNVNLFKYFDNYNNALNHNVFSNNSIITNEANSKIFKSIDFDSQYNNNDSRLFNLDIPNTENNIIKAGDSIKLSFFNRICNNMISLTDEAASFLIVNNKICRNAITTNLKLNSGDNIVINDTDIYKIIDIFEGVCYLDRCVSDGSGNIIVSKPYTDDDSFFNLYINNKLFKNYSIRIIDNSYTITFKEDVNVDSKFRIDFTEELTSDLIIEDINEIQKVTFCDIPAISHRKNEIIFTENLVKINYKEEVLENNDVMIALNSKERINVNLSGSISKFRNYVELLNLFDVEMVIAITGGSNDIKIINNNKEFVYNTESKIIKLNIPITKIDENGNFNIDIETTGVNTNSKLIITDIVINAICKVDLMYTYYNNQLNYITDYLFINNGKVEYNTCEQVAILYKRRNKDYIRKEDCTIIKTLDNDLVIYINNELYNNVELPLSKRYIYNEVNRI